MKIFSDLLAWEQCKLAQVLNSNLISDLLCQRKLKWKNSHKKILNELYVIGKLTKLLYYSSSENVNVFLL